jgi:hypothetical protein
MRAGDIIFLSASVPYREGFREDANPAAIEEAIVSIARAVFARGGRLLFGGHPSVSPLIASIAGEYFPPDPARVERPVVTFQSEFYRGKLPDETWQLVRMGWSSIQWAPNLDVMRDWMLLGKETPPAVIEAHRLRPPKAMFAVGGMEGVVAEADLFLSHREDWGGFAPILALTSGGGAARRLPELRKTQGLEDLWRREFPGALPPDIPVQPYAAMVQWALDRL